jgi:Ser/Thr protein kinase RdoA (MazF antagonist)
MDIQLLDLACKRYGASPEQLIPLSGGHFNAVYEFSVGTMGSSGILRIGIEDCPTEQTLGMLEWVNFLRAQGAPVSGPLKSMRGHLLERLEYNNQPYNITCFEKVSGTLAENIPPNTWTDELFHAIGRAVGQFHAISKKYQPSHAGLTRPQWYDSYEITHATSLLQNLTDPAGEKLARLLNYLVSLPQSPADYGLIHDDLHFANFLVGQGNQVTVIDFDDCGYGWFVIDVAMAVFDVMVLYNPLNDVQGQIFARRFLRSYLSGYREQNQLDPFWQAQIGHFLKLKELCIYADLIGHPDIHQPDSWVGRFMRGRAERVANDTPYIDIDFSLI